MNIERFHNEIAMRLGYDRIVKDNRISIKIEESDDPWLILKVQDCPQTIRIKASDTACEVNLKVMTAFQEEVKIIFEVVHKAYLIVNDNRF